MHKKYGIHGLQLLDYKFITYKKLTQETSYDINTINYEIDWAQKLYYRIVESIIKEEEILVQELTDLKTEKTNKRRLFTVIQSANCPLSNLFEIQHKKWFNHFHNKKKTTARAVKY